MNPGGLQSFPARRNCSFPSCWMGSKRVYWRWVFCCAVDSMNESQRRAYLQAMGIQAIYPRFSFPHARPSPEYEFDPAVSERVDSRAQPRTSASEARIKVDAVRAPNTIKRPVSQSPAPQPSVEVEATSGPFAERFSLRYFAVNSRLAVLDELPLEQSQESDHAVTLLGNILRALAIGDTQDLTIRDSFDWPPALQMPATAEPALAAPRALHGFIASRRAQDGFSNLLVFAGRVESMLMDEARGVERDFPSTKGDFHLTVTHSLQSMLAVPALKRDVWQHLQALRQRLSQ